MATITRPLQRPPYTYVPGPPPPLNTISANPPASIPRPAQTRPAPGGTVPFAAARPVTQLDPSDRTTWPAARPMIFTR
jgi:hypothetical protein